MPELPEVETVARDLRPRIVGATIVGVGAVAAGVYFAFLPPAPTGEVEADAAIAGPTVQVGQGGVQLGWQGRF